jgi:hypothetical protein
MTASTSAAPRFLPTLPTLPDGAWAAAELGHARLGDARRTQRLVEVASALGAQPTASIPEACGAWGRTKAAYRLLDLPHRVPELDVPGAILAAHSQATVARSGGASLLLAVQDTTSLDFTTHPATDGLGRLEHPAHRGLFVHSTLAVTPADGVPLGLLDVQVWARDDATAGSRHQRKARPTAEKESQKWLAAVASSRPPLPASVTLLHVGDREADVYDLFQAVREQPHTELLIRAQWDRRVTEPEAHLLAVVAAQAVAEVRTIAVPRADERPARTATVELRYAPVTLRPPRHRSQRLPTIPLVAIAVEERDPPAGVEPLSWRLLTSLAVPDVAAAWQCVTWYTSRWRIERYHLVLKSGCRIEQRQLETAARLEVCLALYSVIAVQLLRLLYASRATPEAPGTAVLAPEDWPLLWAARHPHQPPPPLPTVRAVVREIAGLGGFLGRRGDGEPGAITLWRGLRRLDDLRTGYHLARSSVTQCG